MSKMSSNAVFVTFGSAVLFIFLQGMASADDFSNKEREGQGYHLKPAATTVGVGGSVALRLVYCESKTAPAGEASGELAPLSTFSLECDESADDGGDKLERLVAPSKVGWEVIDGQGSIKGGKEGATYHAPTSMPHPNKATVSATLTYTANKQKTILNSTITILDKAESYVGTFTTRDVAVNLEYTEDISGKIKWEFDEYDDIGGVREYTGSGVADYTIQRVGCGGPATFSRIPVEGRLQVYDDQRYEFQIDLNSDEERTRTCTRPDLDKDLKWEETFSAAGISMTSADRCGESEFYPKYSDVTDLSYGQNRSCRAGSAINRFQSGWSFKATE